MDVHKAFATLREILAFLYEAEGDARRIAKDAGLDVKLILFSGKAIDNWNAILIQAQKENRIVELMGISFSEYRKNEKLAKAWHDYLVTEERQRTKLISHQKARLPQKWISVFILSLVAD